MISPEQLRTKLSGYPEGIFRHFEAFHATRNEADLNRFIILLIRFLHDENLQDVDAELPDGANLRTDLDIDSITIAEVVFLIEDIFKIEIPNEELTSIQTVGELKSFVSRKIT